MFVLPQANGSLSQLLHQRNKMAGQDRQRTLSSQKNTALWGGERGRERGVGEIVIPYSRKIWRFGRLYYNHQITIRQNFLLTYMYTCMAILYRTAKFKSTNILAIAILGSTTKFNSRQYFRLYDNWRCMYSWPGWLTYNPCDPGHRLLTEVCFNKRKNLSQHFFGARLWHLGSAEEGRDDDPLLEY